ncbi:MAG: hypothetical protein ACE5IR_06145 [bacterium]
MRYLSIAFFLFVIGIAACSSTTGAKAKKGQYSRNRISAEDIMSHSTSTAYEIIQRLRPIWLQGRGRKALLSEQASYPVVYVNGRKHGTLGSLSNFSAHEITEIRFYSAADATTKFGTNHPSGVIDIILL